MKYWFILNGVQLGPVEESELAKVGITPDTPVWHEGLAEWKSARDIPALAHLFEQTPPRAEERPSQESKGSDFIWRPCPETYLAWNIISTILCCLPFGIVGIIYSAQVSSCHQRGDFAGAERASRLARNWLIAGVVSGIVINGVAMLATFPAMILAMITGA